MLLASGALGVVVVIDPLRAHWRILSNWLAASGPVQALSPSAKDYSGNSAARVGCDRTSEANSLTPARSSAFLGVRARLGGKLVAGVPQVVKVRADHADDLNIVARSRPGPCCRRLIWQKRQRGYQIQVPEILPAQFIIQTGRSNGDRAKADRSPFEYPSFSMRSSKSIRSSP